MDSYNGILQLNRNTTDRDSGIKKSVEPRYPLTFTIINIAGQSFGHIPRFDACRYHALQKWAFSNWNHSIGFQLRNKSKNKICRLTSAFQFLSTHVLLNSFCLNHLTNLPIRNTASLMKDCLQELPGVEICQTDP